MPCGLCGKSEKLIKTECCNNWICDDSHKYVMHSFSKVSCDRNHTKYTLCAYHAGENHSGKWQKCLRCKSDFKTETYVWYGTNEYNFVKLRDPPSYDPTRCAKCDKIIVLHGAGGNYTVKYDQTYVCGVCLPRNGAPGVSYELVPM